MLSEARGADWLVAASAYPGFCSMKRLRIFIFLLDGMLVHRRSLPRNFVRFPQQFAGTHLYPWVERAQTKLSSSSLPCCQHMGLHSSVSPAPPPYFRQNKKKWQKGKNPAGKTNPPPPPPPPLAQGLDHPLWSPEKHFGLKFTIASTASTTAMWRLHFICIPAVQINFIPRLLTNLYLWSVTKYRNNLVHQSNLQANTNNWCKARESLLEIHE